MKNINKANILISYYLIMIFVHIFIIIGVLPYDWVNGGMSPSYKLQALQSIISIAALSAVTYFIFNLIKSTPKKHKLWKHRLVYILTALTVVGFVLQLIGTDFEKFILAPIVAMGLILHLQFAIKLHSLN